MWSNDSTKSSKNARKSERDSSDVKVSPIISLMNLISPQQKRQDFNLGSVIVEVSACCDIHVYWE